jgi:hypothetical protein
MRAVKGKHGILSLISTTEARVYNQVEFDQFLPESQLDERQHHLAEELFRKNVLRKLHRSGVTGYAIYPQKRLV